MHMMHGAGSLWSIIFMIIFWAGLFSFGIFLLSNIINGGTRKHKTGLQIIKERLAKGEIDEMEYERLKSVLKQD